MKRNEVPSRTQKIRFTSELFYTLMANKLSPFSSRDQKHVIVQNGNAKLILCTMPIATKFCGMGAHHEQLANECKVEDKNRNLISKLDLVIAAVQDFELDEGGIPYFPVTVKPATESDWKALGVTQFHQIKMLDHHAQIPDEKKSLGLLKQIHAEVDAIDATLKAGNSVVVHCKAGVGRSALIVACYLATKDKNGRGFFSSNKLLSDKRPQVNLNDEQIDMIKKFVEYYKSTRPTIEQPTIDNESSEIQTTESEFTEMADSEENSSAEKSCRSFSPTF